jgi:hypothetical protein
VPQAQYLRRHSLLFGAQLDIWPPLDVDGDVLAIKETGGG